ncbi:MAG: hypothetical protein QM793_02790 [Muricomes sp.]
MEKQNSVALNKRLARGFGIVNIITILIALVGIFAIYKSHSAGGISTGSFAALSL